MFRKGWKEIADTLQELGVGHSDKHEVCGGRTILLVRGSISSALNRT